MSWRDKIAEWTIRAVGANPGSVFATFIDNKVSAPRMGSKDLLKAYNTMPWLRAVVGRTSWSVASAHWQLFAATEKPVEDMPPAKARRYRSLARSMNPTKRQNTYKALRRSDQLREIEQHPALDLLDYGNERFPGVLCTQLAQQHLDLIGESAWLMDKNALGVSSAIYPLPPTWVTELPRNGGNTYLISAPGGSLQVPKEDLVYMYHPNPADPYERGTGIAGALGDELETDEAAAKHLKAWFRNRARPDILIHGETLSSDNIKRLSHDWMTKLSGTQGFNKPHFINRKIDVEVLSQNFKDMELSTLRKDERDIFIHVYGMPPEIFGILESSNRATIDAADYLMGKYIVVPRLEFLRIWWQIQIIEHYDERLILDYVSPIQEDREYELKVMQAQPAAFVVNEWRAQAGKPEDKDRTVGEGRLVPFNTEFVEKLEEAEEPLVPEGIVPGAPGIPPVEEENGDGSADDDEDAEE
jgi:hypothetical protein